MADKISLPLAPTDLKDALSEIQKQAEQRRKDRIAAQKAAKQKREANRKPLNQAATPRLKGLATLKTL